MTIRRFLAIAFYGGERPPTISPARWRAMYRSVELCPEWILMTLMETRPSDRDWETADCHVFPFP